MLKLVVQPKDVRRLLVDYARTISDKQNLDLLTAVYNEEKDYYFTLVYFMSDCIKRCDEPDDYTYVVVKGSKIYPIYRKEGRQMGKMVDNVFASYCPIVSEEEAWQLIKFYVDNSYDRRHTLKAKDDNGQEMNNYDLLAYYFPKDFTRAYPRTNAPKTESNINTSNFASESFSNTHNTRDNDASDYNKVNDYHNVDDSNKEYNTESEDILNNEPKDFVIKRTIGERIKDFCGKYPNVLLYVFGMPLLIPILWIRSWLNNEEFDWKFATILLIVISVAMIAYDVLKYMINRSREE